MKHTIHDILEEFREAATSKRDLGDRFERLICRYLELDPLYADRFSDVWMWNEWPGKGNVGDVGIDLVAKERATGEFCAIQCKFYLPDHTLSKADIDSFFTAAGKEPFTSCMIVSTTDKWGKNAEDALANQSKPVIRLRVQDLDASPVDWSKFSLTRPQDLQLRAKKQIRDHQKNALQNIVSGFTTADRGKLIMACGTGKTFTALKLAERMAPQGHVLFLVPSLSLLSQSLREWTAESDLILHSMAVCSDTKVGKKVTKPSKNETESADITTCDLAFPATTSAQQILRQYKGIHAIAAKKGAAKGMTVVFSTYQSILAVSEAQKAGLPEFDLIICDEAHRTTGVTLSGEDESHFIKIHDATFIRGKKRLYMTATPRIYSDDTKVKAKDAAAELCSMDDPAVFGEEFHRLGFGEAVSRNLLSDYKVLVLAVDEKYVTKTFQRQIADANNELNLEDAVKITGCWNGLAKRLDRSTAPNTDLQGDTAHMRRAVAFSRSIAGSKAFVRQFGQIIEAYRETHPDEDDLLHCELDHVDGTYNALKRNELLDWLKAESTENTCRILSNARCLSEGVDVPALDAVIFLNPRNSIVDVVQSVGRVMRRAEGKQYGYIILPVGIPADMAPEEALKDNEKYKVVWQVLQALRAHDDRFNATVNQIELNKKRPDAIQIIGVGGNEPGQPNDGDSKPNVQEIQGAFLFPHLEEWKDAIYARIVLKCGDRRYWESWAKDVAVIAERHITRIKALLESGEPRHKRAFAEFLQGLRQNINPSISEDDAIEMLSQHLITRPVFDALFDNYSFTQNNPVSLAMQKMLNTLEDQALEKETATLEKFYASVKERATGIDNAQGKQRIVIELYDTFFRTAFPKMAERLGIVYTPVEVVDFIIHSVNDVLKHEFRSSLGDKDVHIIDPFTGTGTFLVRLLQSGHIQPADLLRKYQNELHANEIILLAYYIAAINIEETFHALLREQTGQLHYKNPKSKAENGYVPFQGIVLTDTFQISESKNEMDEKMFPENNQRVKRQKASPIRVVIANPPYSSGQTSENDGNKNLKYPQLDERIRSTYAERSTATNKNSLYDSYIRALRWASDRIADRGIVSFVSNGSFIDGNAMEGVRACLAEEFSTIYVFNLRGNQRTSGETSRMEGGKIFGSGSRASIAISVFIKNPEKKGPCELFYHDIGDYLSREEKLEIITKFQSINGLHQERRWESLQPNANHDWINQRDEVFETFVSLGDKKDENSKVFFENYSSGVKTNRDNWCYNFSKTALTANMRRMIDFYNEQVEGFAKIGAGKLKAELPELAEKFIDTDAKKISWSRGLKNDLSRGVPHQFNPDSVRRSIYRPYCKQTLYTDKYFNDMIYQIPKIFPKAGLQNLAICVTGIGATKDFSALISSTLPDLELISKSQCFPLYLYEKEEPQEGELISRHQEGELIDGYRRRDAISDAILTDFRSAYEARITKEDIFYYVYGILHSEEYKTRFASDLKKMLPRIPFTKETSDFWKFSQAGRDLARWHLNYETIEPYPLTEHKSELTLVPQKHYQVQKMIFGRKDKAVDKTTIIYNSHLTLAGIPPEAYEYVVNGKPALEWVMERYQITVDKDSGIRNDPNDWMTEHKDPTYLVNLLKRITRVSLETLKIVKSLPALNEKVAA
ncbi:MAG: DEAD/DEAH box helicase family protein [Methylacidiphilales bacterium]|nr:DEAD/DEAH box helicase family protein [Candidatus Methylacidiphilales bacterium]